MAEICFYCGGRGRFVHTWLSKPACRICWQAERAVWLAELAATCPCTDGAQCIYRRIAAEAGA